MDTYKKKSRERRILLKIISGDSKIGLRQSQEEGLSNVSKSCPLCNWANDYKITIIITITIMTLYLERITSQPLLPRDYRIITGRLQDYNGIRVGCMDTCLGHALQDGSQKVVQHCQGFEARMLHYQTVLMPKFQNTSRFEFPMSGKRGIPLSDGW